MGCAQYRLYLNSTPATADQLARFEDITIEQQMDIATEAKFQVPLCMDTTGMWDGETDAFLEGMSRIRLELQLQSGPWVPLIDGTITNVQAAMFNEPGKSMLTLVVTDDTFYLHRDESVSSFQGQSDDQIASQIFNEVSQISSTDVDPAPSPSNPGFNTTVLRGTQMELLKQLAQRQHMHVYVTPGDTPGQSVGCFKLDPDPNKDFGLAPMVLVGSGQNIFRFQSDSASGQTATYNSGQVNLNDSSKDTRTADPSDISMQGTTPPPGNSVKRLLPPGQPDALSLARAVQAASERAAYALKAHGEVMKDTYSSILQPYQNVQVVGINGSLSGLWLIQQVTHTLTRNSYGQTFRVIRNAQSAGTNSPAPQVPAGVF
jgi:hypothetical protein